MVDFPGKVATILFTFPCNFACPYCYNIPELSTAQEIPVEEILSFLNRRKGLLDGVVICGGEPLIHEDLEDFIREIKKLGFLVKLDTNGSLPERLERLLDANLVDYVAMDFKTLPEARAYERLVRCRGCFRKILQSVEIIKEKAPDYEFRTTFVPGLVPIEHSLQIAEFLSPAKAYCLQNFFSEAERYIDPGLKAVMPYPPRVMEEFAEKIKSMYSFEKVCVRA